MARLTSDWQFWLDKISVGRVARAEGLAAGAEGRAVRARGAGQKGQEWRAAPLKIASWSTVRV